ncbi:ATP-grasp fold amidoligase family protein [Neobacillus kokaensis]|uniref:Glycosyl transferase n=1 Tax=Neobacillus kokaensis TaxID=2759023 RepID=A0ABQ3N4I6_9BACI|nr:ATP-grasp fold amidoligase family protein [Neobacillus kokaensis]GHH99564.1 glycosyl transferase [Neobacillus kokaensis]
MRKRIRKNEEKYFSDKINRLKTRFKRHHHYELNLANPRTFSEKIQWTKLYGRLERFSKYADKYEVRQYVQEKIGKQYLIPFIGVYDRVDEIDWNTLPESFVMKANHAWRTNIIVKDKTKIDWKEKKLQMENWLKLNFGEKSGQPNYYNIKPRIVIEELIKDPTGDLKDYKFFCFHGEPKFIQVDGERFNGHERDLFDLNWNKLPFRLGYNNDFKDSPSKPTGLNEMIKVAQQLSSDFPFVRVDLYYTNEHIYFGELTFTPGNGLTKFRPRKYDDLYGTYLDITRYQ